MFGHAFGTSHWRHRAIHLHRLRALLEPRKPRHHAARVLVALAGVAVLAVLLVVGLVVGAAMLVGGLAWKLFARRPAPARRDVLDADYRVVARTALPR